MDGNKAPDFAIGAVSNDGDPVVLYVRSKPTIALTPKSSLKIPAGVIKPNSNGTQGDTYTQCILYSKLALLM